MANPITEPTSLRALVELILVETIPLGQFDGTLDNAIATADLGLGFAYYSLARILKPCQVVVVGSYRGFSVVCFAIGLLHNGVGRLRFIDAAVVDDFWRHEKRVREHFDRFGVGELIEVQVRTTQDCMTSVPPFCEGQAFIDLLLIDGDHSQSGMQHDFQEMGALVKDGGLICLHDSFSGGIGKTRHEVADYIATLDRELYESLVLPCGKGLTLLRKLGCQSRVSGMWADVDEVMGHLEASMGSSPDLSGLKAALGGVLRDLRDRERVMEIRRQYLERSREALYQQVEGLKREVRSRRENG